MNTSWRRQWQPTPVLLPGKSHGRRSLVGCRPWGRKESDTTERLYFHFSLSYIGEGSGPAPDGTRPGRIPRTDSPPEPCDHAPKPRPSAGSQPAAPLAEEVDMVALAVLLGLVVLGALAWAALYNGLVTKRNAFRNAFSQIDVQL